MHRNISTILKRLEEDVVEGAKELLGCHLVHGNLRGQVVETEAYHQNEAGCHAFRGETPRTRVMFGPAGFAYVYFTYGNHWMLNVVAHSHGEAAAVLIRALVPLEGLEEMRSRRIKARSDYDLLSGPGKLCEAFSIDARHNGIDLFDSKLELHLEAGEPVRDLLIGTRIGLAAGKGDELPWRFLDRTHASWASKPLPKSLQNASSGEDFELWR